MQIIFGLELDDLVLPKQKDLEGGIHYFGVNGLLAMLESHLGLIGHPTNNEFLRIEQFRQAILRHSNCLEISETVFYSRSFEADQFATATELLNRRDELLLAGWDFKVTDETPIRLTILAEIEQVFETASDETSEEVLANVGEKKLEIAFGFADRFMDVLEHLKTKEHPISKVLLNEPFEKLPNHFQRLFDRLKIFNPDLELIQIADNYDNTNDSDLNNFKNRLLSDDGEKEKLTLKNDGSLLLLKAKRASDAANYLAKIFKFNTDFKPACLIPEKNRALDIALIQEGLPSLGILSASLARPTLQILKLVPAFLWQPIDPFKILEFVSLSVKPLDDDLANAIANQMAQTPGLNGEGWYITINRFFDDLQIRAQQDTSIFVAGVREQYQFWFERRRYDMGQTVPKKDVVEIYSYVKDWAFEQFDEGGGKNNSLLVLSEQAKRIVELLEVLPELRLTFLELERIVRTIYEPSPIVFQEKEVGHFEYVMQSSAIIDSIDDLIWWNFVQNEPAHFFSRWYNTERVYLESTGIQLVTPQKENELLVWQRSRPVIQTQKKMLIVLPEMVGGNSVHPHPLFGDLEANFENLKDIIFDLGSEKGKANFTKHFQLPEKEIIPQRYLGKPKTFLEIANLSQSAIREYETLTSLETLFYFPYQWMFKYKIKLHPSSILSIVKDNTLMGNLAHRMFEKLFREDINAWDKLKVEDWIEQESKFLLSREGAVLLMYGREPERVAFINKLKYAAWSLVSKIQHNGWQVAATEAELTGKFLEMPIRGRADLVLERGDEKAIIDLKWRGEKRRENIIKSKEDLQLILYSRLLTEDDTWAHTAYFIIENGKLISRNNHAFKNITAVSPDSDHIEVNAEVLSKMEATYQWRMEQLQKGKVEIRCEQTALDLEDIYFETNEVNWNQVLEMKDGDAPFDDYRTLINLIE